MNTEQDIYTSGYKAFLSGIPCSQCPYSHQQMDGYLEWQLGWSRACRDTEEKEYCYE